jgi:hypothetical protein
LYYPYVLYNQTLRHLPVFPGLQGDPFFADLSRTSTLLKGIDARDQQLFQSVLEAKMGRRHQWGLCPYLERRDTLLADCPQMVAEKRFFHLGLDVIVPVGTVLHAPLDAVVAQSGFESGEGNYGGYVLLEHTHPEFETFFSFYGHLCKDRLPGTGRSLKAGEAFAAIGDFHENGNWFYHTHIQVITGQGLERGFVSKGYCSQEDLPPIQDLCPSPVPLFLRPAGAA